MRDGTYGICEITAKPISKERLLAVPFTRYSADAQKQIERNRHHSRTQAGLFGESGEEGAARSWRDDGGGDEVSGTLDPGLALSWRILRYKWLIAIAAAVFAADQASKAWIVARLPFNTYGEAAGAIPVLRGFFYIVHVGNTGAAWSVFTGRSLFLAALAAASLVAIFIWRKSLGLTGLHAQVCFGLLCGGIAGNLLDRILKGHVVDFPRLPLRLLRLSTFNVADSAICVGGGALRDLGAEDAAQGLKRRHSTFAICSRTRSSSFFRSITAFAIARSLALLPIVLASRPISWRMKSALRPISSPEARERRQLLGVAAKAGDLLADVGAVGEKGHLAQGRARPRRRARVPPRAGASGAGPDTRAPRRGTGRRSPAGARGRPRSVR